MDQLKESEMRFRNELLNSINKKLNDFIMEKVKNVSTQSFNNTSTNSKNKSSKNEDKKNKKRKKSGKSLPPEATDILTHWFLNHCDYPYPEQK